ncbi:MAG: HD domain-containing protein [Candidatus Izimaplasma sp.]|nr:HD domain-containing protein [Candidatus Izimaplasma bacterium]
MLKRYALIFLICVFISFVGVISGIYLINMNGISVFEKNQIEHKKDTTKLYFDGLYRQLEIILTSHAVWTDSNIALKAKDAIWLETYVSKYLIEGDFDVDFVLIRNEDETFTQAYNIDSSQLTSTQLYDRVLNNKTFEKSLIWINENAYLISGIPFQNDDRTDKNGILIIGMKLDDEKQDNLKTILGELHQDHLIISNDQSSFLEQGIDDSLFITIDSIDDPVKIYAHFEFEFSDYLKSSILRHSLIISSVAIIIISLSFIKMIKKFNSELNYTVNKIQLQDPNNPDYKKIPLSRFPELNRIIAPFNILGKKVSNNYKTVLKKNIEIVKILSRVSELNDSYTKEHGDSVSHLVKLIGKKLDVTHIDQLVLSAKLHDIGKVFIPLDILNKKGKLTKKEYDIVKEHPKHAFDILNGIKGFDLINSGIMHHHERYDGKGYPDGLSKNNIPLFARIIAVADVFDALTSDRSYRKAFSKEKAIKIIRDGKHSHFDPDIVGILLEIIKQYEEVDNET